MPLLLLLYDLVMKPDLADLDQLRRHLSRHGLFAKKNFGQNFLIDAEVLDQIVGAADLTDQDTVIEVGPGPGVLSQRLAPQVAELQAVEIDEKMITPWQDLMSEHANASILNQDVLAFTPPDKPYKLVANIPYYITSPILKHFLRHQQSRRPDVIVLMIQKEVAQRICDRKKPTLLSWEIRVFGEPEIVCTVPSSSFYPAPKVDSAVLKIRVLEDPLVDSAHIESWFKLLGLAYKQPRKTLLNNLIAVNRWNKEELDHCLQDTGLDGKMRPHQLGVADWTALMQCIT